MAASNLKQVIMIRKFLIKSPKLSKEESRNFDKIPVEKSNQTDLEIKETLDLVKNSKISPEIKEPVKVKIPRKTLYVPLYVPLISGSARLRISVLTDTLTKPFPNPPKKLVMIIRAQ